METTFKDRAPGRKLAFALTIILLLFSASCGSDGGSSDAAGGGGGGGTVTDTTAPTLASSVPADNATGIAVNANVTLTFSETMTGVSVTTDTTCTGSVQLSKDNFTTCVAGALSSSDNITYEFNPSADLDASTTYKVKILADAKDAAGNAMAETTTSFTTEAGADTTAPTFAGATGATADSSSAITISWSTASDDVTASGSIVYDIYQASTSGGQNYTTATATSAAGATSHQITGLAASTTYYFVVRARDAAGNRDTNTTQVNATTSAGGGALTSLMINEWGDAGTGLDYIEIKNYGSNSVTISDTNFKVVFGATFGTEVILNQVCNDSVVLNCAATTSGISIAANEIFLIVESDVTDGNLSAIRGYNSFSGKIFVSSESTLIGTGDRLSENPAKLCDNACSSSWSLTPVADGTTNTGTFGGEVGTSTYSHLVSTFSLGDDTSLFANWQNGTATAHRTAGTENP